MLYVMRCNPVIHLWGVWLSERPRRYSSVRWQAAESEEREQEQREQVRHEQGSKQHDDGAVA